jgi:hypothetical protein
MESHASDQPIGAAGILTSPGARAFCAARRFIKLTILPRQVCCRPRALTLVALEKKRITIWAVPFGY